MDCVSWVIKKVRRSVNAWVTGQDLVASTQLHVNQLVASTVEFVLQIQILVFLQPASTLTAWVKQACFLAIYLIATQYKIHSRCLPGYFGSRCEEKDYEKTNWPANNDENSFTWIIVLVFILVALSVASLSGCMAYLVMRRKEYV